MSSSVNQQQLIWSDAWILLSILITSDSNTPASLAKIIGAGDYIQHAIFTRGELETGLIRLINAGYVCQDKNGFSPTETVSLYWSTTASKKRYIHDALNLVAKFIDASEWRPGNQLPEASTEQYVSVVNYNMAVNEYKNPKTRERHENT